MKKNIRSKISDFLKSEEGRVGVKPPLVFGAASAGLLLAQAIVTPPLRHIWSVIQVATAQRVNIVIFGVTVH